MLFIRWTSRQICLFEISSSHGGEYDVQSCLLIPDDGGSTHLWNVGRQSFYTAVYPRRCLFEFIRVERGVKFMKLFKGGASYRSFETSGIVSIKSRTVTDWRKSEQLEEWGLYKKCDKEHSEAGPWLRRLVAGLPQRKSGFSLWYVHVGFSMLISWNRKPET
jgi:hypothetical protein